MPVVPPKPRYKVENRETSTRFIIPSRKNWRAIMFSILLLIPWASVEFGSLKIIIKAVQGTISGIESFWGSLTSLGLGWAMLLAWLFLWTLAGSFALYPLLWNLVGKEVVNVGPTSLKIAQKIFFRSKEYDSNYIKDLRVSQPIHFPWLPFAMFNFFWGLNSGIIAFDYGAKTFRFGSGMDEAEAKIILAEITQRYPQYMPK